MCFYASYAGDDMKYDCTVGHQMWLVGVVGVGLCDYCVSSVQRIGFLGFFRLGLSLGSGFGACWDRGLGTWTRA